MAGDIKLNTIVDFDLASGTIDVDKLFRQLPQLLKAAMARLPGVTEVIQPKLVVDPKFDTTKVLAELQKRLSTLNTVGKNFKGVIPEADVAKATAGLAKYIDALQKLQSLQSTAGSFTPETIRAVRDVTRGRLQFSSLGQELQSEITRFQEYARDFSRVNRQIANSFTSVGEIGRAQRKEYERLVASQAAEFDAPIEERKRRIQRNEADLARLRANVAGAEAKGKAAAFQTVKAIAAREAANRKLKDEITELGARVRPEPPPAPQPGAVLAPEARRALEAPARLVTVLEQATGGKAEKTRREAYEDAFKQAEADAERRKKADETQAALLQSRQAAEEKRRSEDATRKANEEARGFFRAEQQATVARLADDLVQGRVRPGDLTRGSARRAALGLQAQIQQQREALEGGQLSGQDARRVADRIGTLQALLDEARAVTKGPSAEQRRKREIDLAFAQREREASAGEVATRRAGVVAQQRTAAEQERARAEQTRRELELNRQRLADEREADQNRRRQDTQARRLRNAQRAENLLLEVAAGRPLEQLSRRDARVAAVGANRRLARLQREIGAESTSDARARELLPQIQKLEELRDALRQITARRAQSYDPELIGFGREKFQQFGGVAGAGQVPREFALPAREYVKAHIQDLEKQRAGLKRNSDEYSRLTRDIANHDKALRQLNDTIRGNHSLGTQLNFLLRQFLRYAVGYAALYQVVAGFRALSTAVLDLQDNLKQIQAITGGTDAEMTRLGESIKTTAQNTRFGLREISEAVKIISQAGTPLLRIPATVQAVANLATATGTSLSTAADIVTTVQNVWDELDPNIIANQVAKVSNVSKLAVENLQSILSLGASFAKNAGLSLEQFLATAAALKNAGVRPSTIATGTSQLLLEVFSPDEKTVRFLQKRYQEIGESLTGAQVTQRFTAFKSEQNPLFAAISELKRLGVDSAGAIDQFSRVIDKRAFNVLVPLLKNFEQLPKIAAQLSTGNASFDAAAVAMESLKATTQNLGDALQVLSESLSVDLLPPLTAAVRKTTEAVEALTDANESLRRQTGDGGGSAFTGAALGAGVAFVRGRGGLLQRAGNAALGAVGGFVAGRTVQEVSAEEGIGSGTSSSLGLGASFLAATGLSALAGKAIEMISRYRNTAKNVVASVSPLFAAAEATAKGGTLLSRSLLLMRGAALRVVGLFSGPLGIATLLVSIAEVFDRLSETDGGGLLKRLRNIDRASQSDFNKLERERGEFTAFREGTTGDSPSPGGPVALLNSTKQNLSLIQQLSIQAAGKQIADLGEVIDVLDAYRVRGLRAGPGREEFKARMAEALGVSVEKVNEQFLQQVLLAFEEYDAGVNAISSDLQNQNVQLADEAAKTSGEMRSRVNQARLKFFTAVWSEDPTLKKILAGQTADVSRTDIIRVQELYLDFLNQQSDALVANVDTVMQDIAATIEALKTDPSNPVGLNSLKQKIALAQRELGDVVFQPIVELLSQLENAPRAPVPKGFIRRLYDKVTGNEETSPVNASPIIEAVRAQLKANDLQTESAFFSEAGDTQGRLNDAVAVLDNPEFAAFLASRADIPQRVFEAKAAKVRDLQQRTKEFDFTNPPRTPEEKARFRSVVAELTDIGVLTPRRGNVPSGLAPPALSDVEKVVGQFLQSSVEPVSKGGRERFLKSDAYLAREAQIRRLERSAADLEREDPQVLAQEGAQNPLLKIAALQTQNLQEELAFVQQQTDDELDIKKERIQKLEEDIENASADARKKIDQFQDQAALKRLADREKTLGIQERELQKRVDDAVRAGDSSGLAAAQAELERVILQRSDVELERLQRDKREDDVAKQEVEQRKAFALADRARKSAQENREVVLKTLSDIAQAGEAARSAPSPGYSIEQEAYLNAARQNLPKQVRLGKVTADLAATREEFKANAAQLQILNDQYARYVREQGESSEAAMEAARAVKDLEEKQRALSRQVGELTHQQTQLQATLSSELAEVTVDNIAAQIDDLGGSMKNLGENLKGLAVSFLDNWTTAVAEFVVNGFRAEGAAENLAQALERVRDAELQLSQVQLERLGVEDSISALSTQIEDPVIRARVAADARAAQDRAEQLAQEQVDLARGEASDANPSLFDITGDMLTKLGQDISTTILKAGLLNGIQNVLGGGLFGEKGHSPANPLFVNVVNGGVAGAVATAAGAGGGLIQRGLDFLGGLFNFGGGGGGTNPTGGITTAGGAGNGAGFFSGLLNVGSKLMSFLPFARGGGVPGTGYGDTVPALLTPGEFVLSKPAVKAIGLKALHAVNRSAQRPMRLAAGGLVAPTLASPGGSSGTYNGQAGGVHVSMTVNTPDAAGFRRSQAQILADMQAQLQRSQRRVM